LKNQKHSTELAIIIHLAICKWESEFGAFLMEKSADSLKNKSLIFHIFNLHFITLNDSENFTFFVDFYPQYFGNFY